MQKLDQNFWKNFAKAAWEKKSVTVRQARSPFLQLDGAQIFKLLLAYSDRCRRRKNAQGMKFFLEGQRQFDSETLRHLPRKSDRSLEGYHQRMSSQYDDYCLVCDELLQVNHEQHDNLIEFLTPLFASVGFPHRFAEMGLYLGNYRKTPFGVHVDGCGVFSFPVAGVKRFRIWKPGFVKKNPSLDRSFTYAKFKSASRVLEAGVGDMTYWPSSAYHIAESDGSFSATWSLGVWVDRSLHDVIAEVIGDSGERARGGAGGTVHARLKPTRDGEIKNLPREFRLSRSVGGSVSGAKIDSAFRLFWMAHLSKDGLKSSPSTKGRLSVPSTVRLKNARRPVRWMRDGLNVIYAFNGSTYVSKSKSFLRFIIRLNHGQGARPPKNSEGVRVLARAGAFAADDAGKRRTLR